MSGSVELEAFIDESIKRSLEKGYTANVFTNMRHRYGTVETIKRLLTSKDIQIGFKKLAELGLLDFSIEAAVLKFPEEFTHEEQKTAKWRLEQVRKDFNSQYDIFSERKKRAKKESEDYRNYEMPKELRNQILNVLKSVVSVFTRRDDFTQYWHDKWNEIWNIYCRKKGILPEKYDVVFAKHNCGGILMENSIEDVFDVIDIAFQFMTEQKVSRDRLKEQAGELNSLFRNASVGYQLVENRMTRFDSNDKDTQTEMRQGRIDSLVKWFRENYQDPGLQLPVDDDIGGYRWIYGGSYKANEVLANRFPEESKEIIEAAVKEIESDGTTSWSPIPGPKDHDNREPAHGSGSEDIVAELNTLIANSPTSRVAPTFDFGDDRLLHINFPPDSQNIASDNALFEELKEAKDNLNKALNGTNAHLSLLEAVEQYDRVFFDEQISIPFLYARGIRLENATDATKRSIEYGDLPPFSLDIEQNLNSVIKLHGTYIMSRKEGRVLVEAASAYHQSPQRTEEIKAAAEELNNSIARNIGLFGEDVKEYVASVVQDIGKGSHPERSNQVATTVFIGLTTSLLSVAVAASEPGMYLVATGIETINAISSFLSNAVPLLKIIVASVVIDAPWMTSLSDLVDRLKNLQNPRDQSRSALNQHQTDFKTHR